MGRQLSLWTKRLQDAGYYCWATGKLDLNDDLDRGMIEVETRNGHQCTRFIDPESSSG